MYRLVVIRCRSGWEHLLRMRMLGLLMVGDSCRALRSDLLLILLLRPCRRIQPGVTRQVDSHPALCLPKQGEAPIP